MTRTFKPGDRVKRNQLVGRVTKVSPNGGRVTVCIGRRINDVVMREWNVADVERAA